VANLLIPQLPDVFKEFAARQTGGAQAPSEAFMTFCHRELIHAQWKILLEDDFIEAWKHGIVITCCDGVARRFYPRIFTHSGDYPEKYVVQCLAFFWTSTAADRILLASIRNMGICPCPRCLIPLSHAHCFGMARDTAQRTTIVRVDNQTRQNKVYAARRLIYEKQYRVNAAAIEGLLKDESLVATSVRVSLLLGWSCYSRGSARMLSPTGWPLWATTSSRCLL
jgi:hypothetical protein